MAERGGRLTTADLVVLALLSERPMHGYAASAELEEREARDWAGVSRPQVYYSLKKLAEQGMIAPADDDEAAPAGPERRVYAPTPAGRRALADALERPEWAEQRPAPPFLTWLALVPHARPDAVRAQVARRRAFLERELARERATLAELDAVPPGERGPGMAAARLMVALTVRHFETELAWLEEVGEMSSSAGGAVPSGGEG